MSRTLKIKVVVGSCREPALIHMWEAISAFHVVEVYALDGYEGPLQTNLPVTMFPTIPDMPGFMRDLDRFLSGADHIIAVETSRLYSFQALRAARKLGIKFSCIAHEYSPFVYEKYANIRAIQHDIYQHTDHFFASSRRAQQLLQMEGVRTDRVTKIPACFAGAEFTFSEIRRDKFRKYVDIPPESILVTLKSDLNDLEPVLTMIQAFRLSLNRLRQSERRNVRLMICGDGQELTKLKYEVADMGLGSQTMFLAQDTTPFLADLLAATDVMIEGRWTRKLDPEPLPWHALAAACSGVQIVVPRGSIAEEWLSGVEVQKIDDFSSMDLAFELASLIEDRPSTASRLGAASMAAAVLSPQASADKFLEVLVRESKQDEKITRRGGLTSFIKTCQVPITYKDARDVLMQCEELREFASTCELEHYSEILRIRGDALVALARADEAIFSFEESLKANQSNFHALRGLGYLAWHGHSHEDALSFFKRGLAVNPNDYPCLVGVGLVYRRLKMFEESVFWLHKAIAVGGPDSPSLSLLVQACLENPDAPEALYALKALRESVGDLPNLVTAIGKLESHQ